MARGRDTELIALRNEELLRRYYYWTEIKRLRFDDTFRILSTREFFISEERIRTIVNQNYEFLQELDREYRSGKNTEDKPPIPPKGSGERDTSSGNFPAFHCSLMSSVVYHAALIAQFIHFYSPGHRLAAAGLAVER